MNEELGCLVAIIVGLAIAGLVFAIGLGAGDSTAYTQYRACLAAQTSAKSDSIAVTLRPECKRWLFPESVK